MAPSRAIRRRRVFNLLAISALVSPVYLSSTRPARGAEVANPSAPGSSAARLFSELKPEQTGINFVQRIAVDDPQSYLYNSGYACGGAAVGDVNGDGRPDVFLVNGPDDNALFFNQGGMRFAKAGAGAAALADSWVWGCGTAMADVDGDADLDVFVCNYDAANRLWLNDGKGNFTDASATAGLDFAGPSHTPYFYDLDNDGDLDLYLMTNRLFYPAGRPAESASELGPDGKPRVKAMYAPYFRVVQQGSAGSEDAGGKPPPPFLLEYGHPDRLYRNDGPDKNGVPQFKDVTRGSGIEDVPGHGLSVLVWDVNNDGLPDIYVANDYTDPDCLWINTGADATGFHFRNAIADYLPYTSFSSMGSDIGDFNGDGRLDFMVADMAGTTHFRAKTTMGEMTGYRRWVLENDWPRQAMRNMLFIDSGAGPFEEVAFQAGVARSDWTWAVKFGDFDLNGGTDMFMTTGAARNFGDSDIIVNPAKMVGRTEWEFFRNTAEGRQENLAFRNEGGLHLSNASAAWGLDKNSMSYGAATGDLDGDGDLDLIATNLADPVSIFQNSAAGGGAHWLKVRLDGQKNRHGIGAQITVKLDDGVQLVRLMAPQTGFISSSEPVAHFGLGAAQRVAGITVQWPGRDGVQSLGGQKADQLLTVREADTLKAAVKADTEAPQPLFVATDPAKSGLAFRHREKPYDDYRREFLLPGKLSQFGPGLAVADVNGDGLDDLFCGGAAGQAGVLFIHQSNHTFRALENPPWTAHADTEDMGALFFDADRDGDADLYIASGSNEWEPGDAHYADHLYLNNTKGGAAVIFAETPAGSLPDLRHSGSCVCGADFDRDGDVDLFVGSRSIPGQYPLTPDSVLLRNDSVAAGAVEFTEITGERAPGLKKAGLVTGALWSDVDGDGWTDLLVTSEWGPVRLFMNHDAKLSEATDAAGLAARTGWWNGVTGLDADGDGDIDYAALNVGYNTKYGHPSAEKPVVLYREDMDGNGVFDLVEAKCSAEGELPVRGRSCSSNAMPFIRDKFKTYKAFASSTLAGIYTDEKLGKAARVTAAEFATGLLINESKPGAPKFTWQPLPAEAQHSPCFGAVAGDFTGDGRPCLALAQNLYSREPETGLWRGALGYLLTPDGKGGFTAGEHSRTGFVLPGDGKALVACDINGDGWPDLAASQNDGPLAVFRRTPPVGAGNPVIVRLAGAPGNSHGIGAIVRLLSGGKTVAVREIYGGAGYLSQSSCTAAFAVPANSEKTLTVSIRWPSGRESTMPVPASRKNPVICPEPGP